KWMVTYSDMITLVLVFFILLFSKSQIDAIKFEQVKESFQSRAILDFLPSAIVLEDKPPSSGNEEDGFVVSTDVHNLNENRMSDYLEEWENKVDALAKLMDDIEVFLEKEGLTDDVTANRTEEGVVLVLQETILFDRGEAELLESGQAFLDEIGGLLESVPNKVRIEGHTDTRP